jgi:hypothetical protein
MLYMFELHLISHIVAYKENYRDSELTRIFIQQSILTVVEILNGNLVLQDFLHLVCLDEPLVYIPHAHCSHLKPCYKLFLDSLGHILKLKKLLELYSACQIGHQVLYIRSV